MTDFQVSTQTEGKVLGVCAWLSDKFDFDVTIIRLIFAFAFIFGFGSPFIIYLVLAVIKPNFE